MTVVIHTLANNGTDYRVEPGTVAPAGQYANTCHLLTHSADIVAVGQHRAARSLISMICEIASKHTDVNSVRRKCVSAASMAALTLMAAAMAPSPAGAETIEQLRSRAQSIADEVTALERRLASLRADKRQIQDAVAVVDRDIAALEIRRHASDLEYRAALDAYVQRAVEVYKSPSAGVSLELILSARDVNDLVAYAHMTSSSAEAARESLGALDRARAQAQQLQDDIDAHKQELLVRAKTVDALTAEIEDTLDARRDAYKQMNERIAALEARARREARRLAAQTPVEPTVAGTPNGLIAEGIPPGFTSTGVSFEGVASWYGPGFEGQTTANGDIFDPDKLTAASRDLPLGSWLYVDHQGKGVVVYVNDRGPYIEGRVLDLSRAAAEAVGISGLGWIRAEVLIKL